LIQQRKDLMFSLHAMAGGFSMGAAAIGARSAWPKYGLFAVVAAMAVFVLWNNERFLVDPHSPHWPHFAPVTWILAPHGLFGALALGLGALQFSSRLRRRRALHRWIGRVYVAGVFIAGPAAIAMAFVINPWFMAAFTTIQASVWMLCTGLAWLFIRRGEVEAHRGWMIRSYAIVLNFLEGRVLMAIPALAAKGMDSVVLVNWACLVLALVGAELVIQWPRLMRAQPPTRSATAPAQ
jgi:uncharacterized membrane protein